MLLVADGAGPTPAAWRDFCLRQADAVVLVARSDTDAAHGSGHSAPRPQPDLVLLGPARPDQRAAWVAATDAWH